MSTVGISGKYKYTNVLGVDVRGSLRCSFAGRMIRSDRCSQAGEEAEVGCRAGLEGEGQHREEEDRGEGGEGGEAFLGVAAHGERVARAAGGRKGIGPLSTVDKVAGVRISKVWLWALGGC